MSLIYLFTIARHLGVKICFSVTSSGVPSKAGGGGIPNQVSSIQVAHVILRNSYIVECLTEQFFLASL